MHRRAPRAFARLPAVFTPLHQSPLFARQAGAYEAMGMQAWSEGVVPWRATTCPLMAEVEAALILAFERDVRSVGALADGAPLTVIDVGAGQGRLGFHLASRLARSGVHARLVLTDVAAGNVAALRAQPQLAALHAQGLIDFAHLDALAPEPLGAPGATVLLAHYLFDTLPHRAVRVTDEGAFEGLLDASEAVWRWRYEPAARPAALDDRPPGTYLLPVGAADALAAWRECFPGPVLVLAAGKGVAPRGPDEDAQLARHGSVSAGVDFDALAAMSPAWHHHAPRQPSDTFALHAFTAGAPLPRFAEAWATRGAANEVLTLLTRFEALLSGAPTPAELLALGEASHADPDLLAQLASRFRDAALSQEDAHRLVSLVARAADQHFLFPQTLDVPFSLAITAHHLGALALAVPLYALSLKERGAHPSTLLNLALALKGLSRHDEAAAALEALLAGDPAHERALGLLAEWRGG